MTTAFQPDFAQSDAFQEHGGVLSGEITGGLAYVNNNDAFAGAAALDQSSASGGYWPDYGQPRRRRIRETHDESPAELQARLTLAAEQIKERAALRKAEARSRYLTEQIRAIYEEQDRLAGLIVALSDELDAQDEEEVAIIMALSG